MRVVILSAFCLSSATLLAYPAYAQDFVANEPVLDIRFDGRLYPSAFTLPLDEAGTVNLGDSNEPKEFCFEQNGRAACFLLEPGIPQELTVSFAGSQSTFKLNLRGPSASFDQAYRDRHDGQVRVEVPPAYEMVNVAIALTPYAEEHFGIVASSPYLDAVRHRYANLRSHPFVQALDRSMRQDPGSYHLLKMNGAAYVLSNDDTLNPSPIYRRIGWAGNALKPIFDEMQDFARASHFSAHYRDFAPLYDQQIAYMRDEVDSSGLIAWLEREFQQVQAPNSVRVLFSPLVGGNQSLATFEDGDFLELQPHVNFPYPGPADQTLSQEAQSLERALILFTELNHGFINPTTETLTGAITQSMPELSDWADESARQGYGSQVSVFTEMVNWALFSVLAHDVLQPEEAEKLAKNISATMEKGRGFRRFAPFQRRFLELRAAQQEGGTVADLIPQLVASLDDIARDAS